MQIWLFLFLNCRPKWTKGQLCPSFTHHALAVLVVFSTMMSQPLFNCFGGTGPVWHYVGCWHRLLFSWTASADVVLSQPKRFASEWMFQAIQIAAIFFFLFFFLSCYVSGTLEWNIISFFIFLLSRSFPCSVCPQFSAALSFNSFMAPKITLRWGITIFCRQFWGMLVNFLVV